MDATARKFDVVVFGASGFTGALVLKRICETTNLRVSAAGRSLAKILAVTDKHKLTGVDVHGGVDIQDTSSLVSMAATARLVINCVGPYRLYGQPVVAACVAAHTDYLDVSGEPEFMERMQVEYHEAAEKAGCFVCSALGFDCVPAEIGAVLCTEKMLSMGSSPHTVESFLHINIGPAGARGHVATFESAVLGYHNRHKLKDVRVRANDAGLNGAVVLNGPRPRKLKTCEWVPRFRAWTVPFMGADASVVKRTMFMRAKHGKPAVHFLASCMFQTRWNLWRYFAAGTVSMFLAARRITMGLLLRFPALFSLGFFTDRGPSDAQLQGTTFTMLHEGYALEAEELKRAAQVRIHGPEPGYVATPLFVAEAAAELLENRASISKHVGKGGVYTPGYLLMAYGDSYIRRIQRSGCSIEVMQIF